MRDKQTWRFIRNGLEVPRPRWFLTTFIDAATVIVERWGPRPTRRKVCGRPVGTWILLLAWLLLPMVALGVPAAWTWTRGLR